MKKINFWYFLFLIPIFLIIFSWFSTGKIISNGSEEILNIFHSQKSAEYSASFWYPVGTGYKIAFLIPRYPTFAFLGVLERIGVPTFTRQAFLLVILMITGIFSMYLLLRKGFNLENPVALVGGIFYSLNIYTMTQVWKRLLYSHITAWAYLPLFIFLWIKWVNTRKFFWLIFFLLSSLFFTYSFSNPVFLLTIWTPAFIFVMVKLWTERKSGKQVVYILVGSFIGLFLWSLVNSWWLYPALTLGSTWTSPGQTWQGDFSSLQAVSKYFPVWEIALLRQSWYLGRENDWHDFYHNPLIILISITLFFITIYGMIRSKGIKYRASLLATAAVGLFISKGTNFPLGYTFFYLLFSNFPITTALRNSYEKFGLVWLLPYTIFFAYGFYYFFLRFKHKLRYLLGSLILVLSCGLLVYPMWTGDIFPPKHRVDVPSYYIEANNYLKQKSSEGRVFHIPFLLEIERLSYSWGYVGEDPSENLFDQESVTKPGIALYNPFYKLLPKFLDQEQFPKILGLLGVEHIVLHKDNIYPKIDVMAMKGNIDQWQGVLDKKEFGELMVYSLNKELVNPRVYAAGSIVGVHSIEDALTKVLEGNIEARESVFILDGAIPSWGIQNFSVPKITFQKRSNDHYEVVVRKADDPFILILNNTFDNLWQAKIERDILKKHFIVNGFANGWLIDKKGDYNIEIILKVWPWD